MSDDFLSRWSRRKRASGTAPTEEEAAPTEAPAPEPPAPEPADEDEAALLARLGLRHPDAMQPGDDFGAFLRAAVPQHLKTLALRKLWRTNPTLACLDGLNDYDDDYTGGGVAPGSLKTSYQVGRGILRRIADVAETAAPEETPAEEASEVGAPAAPESAQGPEAPAAEPRSERHAQATRRRMAFRPHAQNRDS